MKLLHTLLLATAAMLAACSSSDEPVPSELVIDDNPGRDIAIPRSVADGVRLSRVVIDRPDSKSRYFFFEYDEDGWLTNGGIPYAAPFEVVGHLDTIKMHDTAHRRMLYHLIHDIKRNADGHVTSLVVETEDNSGYGNQRFCVAKDTIETRFSYDADMRLLGFEETVRRWCLDFQDNENGDTLHCNYNAVFAYEYDGDAIRRITSRRTYVPALDSCSVETIIADFTGEEVENRYGTFDFFTSTHGQTMYWVLAMTGYMGEWAKRIPCKTHNTRIRLDASGEEVHRYECDYDLLLESDDNGRLYSERNKYFIYQD